jgi:hypothetical protein
MVGAVRCAVPVAERSVRGDPDSESGLERGRGHRSAMSLPYVSKTRGERGSTLLMALCVCIVVGIILASFLTMLSSRYNLSTRSTAWNTAIPVLEAGIEEAFTHLADDSGNPSANNWTSTNIAGQTVYWKRRNFSDGSFFYTRIHGATSNAPTIYSSGFVLSPIGDGTYLTRTVRIQATNPGTIFNKAIASKGPVTLSGGAVVDGYDSRLGSYGGTNVNSSGGIGTDGTGNPAVNVGTAKIAGAVTTGPGGTVSVGSSGAVGDESWITNHTGIETPAYTNDDFNVAFPSNSPPTGVSMLSPVITILGSTNATVVTSGTNYMSSFTSSDSLHPLFVTGNATLFVDGNFTVQGSGYVYIAPGASLTLYVSGSTTTISGGGVVNATGLPEDFTYIGLSGNTSITYSGSAAFVGTVNAPEADFTISGSAGAYGAIICNSYTSSGGSSWHYDSSLAGGSRPVATSWTEL